MDQDLGALVRFHLDQRLVRARGVAPHKGSYQHDTQLEEEIEPPELEVARNCEQTWADPVSLSSFPKYRVEFLKFCPCRWSSEGLFDPQIGAADQQKLHLSRQVGDVNPVELAFLQF